MQNHTRRLENKTSYRILLQHPQFKPFLIAQMVTQLGDVLYDLGIIWLTIEATGSIFAAGAVASAGFLPSLLMGPIAGTLADNIHPRKILVWTDIFRAILVGFLALQTYFGSFPPTWLLFIVTFLLGIGLRFYIPAKFAWLPYLIDKPFYGAGNALMSLISQSRLVIGGILTLIVLSRGYPELVFALDALTFIGAAYFTLQIYDSRTPSINKKNKNAKPLLQTIVDAFKSVFSGVVEVLKSSRIQKIFIFIGLDSFLLAGIWTVAVPLLSIAWSDDQGATIFSALQIVYGIGVVAGCYIIGKRLTKPNQIMWAIIIGYLIRAAIYLVLAFLKQNLIVGFSLVIIAGLVLPTITVTIPTLLQQLTKQEQMGRVFGVYSLVNAGIMSLSILLYGAYAQVGVRLFFLTATALCFVMIIVVYQLKTQLFVSN